MTKYSLLIGQSLIIPDEDIDILRYSAMMHVTAKSACLKLFSGKTGDTAPKEYACVQTPRITSTCSLICRSPSGT
ncbi:hypothetical protein KF913_13210 [Candidatus Obscuribacterales bacterium]|nr:hypothetical protein [Candidatus Obscuribacterales bacterium]